MAECKACGEWFGTSCEEDLCPVCQRALDRLKGYAAPVVHGHWIEMADIAGIKILKCSVCGSQRPRISEYFCPSCGAMMDKEE